MTEFISFTISGMKCGGCEANLTAKLLALDGILSATASHQQKHLEVEYDPLKIEIDDIEDAIEKAGFSIE